MGFFYSCRDVTDAVSKLEEGKLSFFNTGRFRLHLLICDTCKQFLAQYEQIRSTIKNTHRDLKLNDETKKAMIERIRQIEN